MTTDTAPAVPDPDAAPQPPAAPERRRLTLDLDVDICVVGAGLAGLTTALEAARMGASVAVLESRHIGWSASGNHLGIVLPGYGVPVDMLAARAGLDTARELWTMSEQGADYMRATASACGVAVSPAGALEVSNVDRGGRLAAKVRLLSDGFGAQVEAWRSDRLRAALGTDRYFDALHFPTACHIDPASYLDGLATLARRAGVRIYEDTPVIGIEASGIRKRIATAAARLRAEHVVLAGSVHLGAAMPELAATLLPTWRYAAVTEPLGERLAELLTRSAVADTDGVDQFRIVDESRLMWASPETTWPANPARFGRTIQRRIRTIFPRLGKVALSSVWSGAVGRTVHGMPQIGELRPGLWVASGFGGHGLNTTALAGQLIARGILRSDDRWRLFAPFELVWAGGKLGQVAGQVVIGWTRAGSAAAGMLARWSERAARREEQREARVAAANRQMAERPARRAGGRDLTGG